MKTTMAKAIIELAGPKGQALENNVHAIKVRQEPGEQGRQFWKIWKGNGRYSSLVAIMPFCLTVWNERQLP